MNHGSLFSGIGGFDLAAEWMGWNNIFHCEWNPFGQKILKHYWPNSISYADITQTDFTIHRGNIDILTGGFPCQPYSMAGKRLGKADERHLFPEMLRCIKEVKPRWIIGENVRGLVSWNGGLVFHEVYDDLEREGYEVQSFLIPACGVNAPHRRDRIWFVAYSNNKSECENSNNREREDCKQKSNNRSKIWDNIGSITKLKDASYSNGFRLQSSLQNRELERGKRFGFSYEQYTWDSFPSVSPICDGNDGFSSKLDGITFSKWRNESIKGGGNAIVPKVVYQIFKAIEEYEGINSRADHKGSHDNS